MIANLVQNVPLNQKVFLEKGWIKQMLAAVDKDPSETVRIKALYALSCKSLFNPLSVQFSSELTDHSKLDNCLFMNGG